jgi:hypothetical protein
MSKYDAPLDSAVECEADVAAAARRADWRNDTAVPRAWAVDEIALYRARLQELKFSEAEIARILNRDCGVALPTYTEGCLMKRQAL